MKITKLITPKLIGFFAGFLLVFSLLLWRLIDIQILQGEAFVGLADANRLFTQRLPVERGVLLDRYGDPLVLNTPKYFQYADPQALYTEKIPLSQSEAIARMASESGSIGYEIERQYLYPEPLSHVLGYTGAVSAEDLERDNRLHMEDTVGKLGLERAFDEVLRGAAGAELYEVNALGEKQRKVGERQGTPGMNIETTIDPYLSEVAYRAMGNQRGAVVILDALSGEILTLVNTPTYDPNVLSSRYLDEDLERERRKKVGEFFSHPQKLFFNRAISGTYPPGSVFKLITALAGLDKDAIDANTQVDDQGVLEVGEYSYANWYYTQYGGMEGNISLRRAIARSNDIYFYKAAEWTGPTSIAQMARIFGLGERTGVELSGEAAGLVPDPAWKEQVLGEKWYLGNTFHYGIGQDNLLVTPLQIAQMVQGVAKRGTLCQPRLIKNNPLLQDSHQDMHCTELGVDEEDLELVLKGMLDACSSGGTAFPFFEHNEAMRQPDLLAHEEIQHGAVACKTGTSEFGAVDENGFKQTHGWFVAVTGIELAEDDEVVTGSAAASESAATTDREKWLEWRRKAREKGFPDELIMVALVESDEAKPYKEGSQDAAPVIKAVTDWMHGKALAVSEVEVEVEGGAE